MNHPISNTARVASAPRFDEKLFLSTELGDAKRMFIFQSQRATRTVVLHLVADRWELESSGTTKKITEGELRVTTPTTPVGHHFQPGTGPDAGCECCGTRFPLPVKEVLDKRAERVARATARYHATGQL